MNRRSRGTGTRNEDAREAIRSAVGFAVITAVLLVGATLVGVRLAPILTTGGVFVLYYCTEFVVVRYSLPEAIVYLFPGVWLLAVCVGLILDDGSRLTLLVAALAAGWILNTAVRKYRRVEPG